MNLVSVIIDLNLIETRRPTDFFNHKYLSIPLYSY